MAVQISNSFIRQYESDVHDVFQRGGSILKPAVRFVDNIEGSSTTFQKIGKGTATTKARAGTITPMNQTHTAIECTLSDFYAGDWVDKLDEEKININERMAIARGGAKALGRKVDDQILTVLDTTSQTTVSWTLTSEGTIRNSMTEMIGDLIKNDAYDPGMVYGVLSPKAWEMALTVKEFASSDYVDANGRPYQGGNFVGQFKMWANVLWTVHSGVPGVETSTSKVFVWHRDAVGYAAGKHPGNLAGRTEFETSVGADISWAGWRAAHFVNHAMSGGACMIDDAGVIEGNLDDTGTVPSS